MEGEAKSDGAHDWGGAAPELRRAGLDGSAPGDEPRKDFQLATQEGVRREVIDGVRIREARTIADDRGTICVAYDPRWGFTEEPMVYCYEVTICPGAIKGWILHETYDDRLLLAAGSVRWVLYDERPDSPTRGKLSELFFESTTAACCASRAASGTRCRTSARPTRG